MTETKSLRETILSAPDIQGQTVTVPEWGVDIEVRGITAAERSDLYRNAAKGDDFDAQGMYLTLVTKTCFDPDTGERIFSEADAEALGKKAASAVERLTKASMTLSGMMPDAVDAEGKES